MTQQNAALVEQAATAAQSLQDQASELTKVVSIFKLNAETKPKVSLVRKTASPQPQPRVAAQTSLPAKNTARMGPIKSLPSARSTAKGRPVADENEWEEF